MKELLFFENAELIYNKFKIIPLMYGSLGLEYITNKNLNSNDIDILIPQIFLKEKWEEFKAVIINKGYTLFDEHEHTFEKDNIFYSYASIEELETFVEIKLADIKQFSHNDIKFKVLTLEQYLKVYLASSKDGYRINNRKKKDFEKITFIKDRIKHTGI